MGTNNPECPDCGVPHDRWSSTASHLFQSTDCGPDCETYADAESRLHDEYGVRRTAEGWVDVGTPQEPADGPETDGGGEDPPEAADGPGDGGGGDPPSDETAGGSGENPMWTAPEATTDDVWCPECGENTERYGAGINLPMQDGRRAVTLDSDDRVCPDCGIVVEPDGNVIRGVVADA